MCRSCRSSRRRRDAGCLATVATETDSGASSRTVISDARRRKEAADNRRVAPQSVGAQLALWVGGAVAREPESFVIYPPGTIVLG